MIARHAAVPVLIVAALCATGCSPGTPPPAAAPATEGGAAAGPAEPAAPAPAAPDAAATLPAYDWRLESATDAAGEMIAALFPTEKALGLSFGDGRVSVTGGCNRLGAGYRLVDATTMELSPGASTMMACPPPLAAADAAIAGFLRGPLQVALEGAPGAPRLWLVGADGATLSFGGTPTPETRFGGPGQRAFLEVSTKPCEPAATATPACLMVRDRFFDEKGLSGAAPGEWRALPEGIEGYTPTAGEEQVVRVKRFETAAGGGGPTVHYVFDMVVQSRTVR